MKIVTLKRPAVVQATLTNSIPILREVKHFMVSEVVKLSMDETRLCVSDIALPKSGHVFEWYGPLKESIRLDVETKNIDSIQEI